MPHCPSWVGIWSARIMTELEASGLGFLELAPNFAPIAPPDAPTADVATAHMDDPSRQKRRCDMTEHVFPLRSINTSHGITLRDWFAGQALGSIPLRAW